MMTPERFNEVLAALTRELCEVYETRELTLEMILQEYNNIGSGDELDVLSSDEQRFVLGAMYAQRIR